MGIFGKPKRAVAPAFADDLFTEAEHAGMAALWRLTALPREEFDATYGGMLARCRRYVAAPGGGPWAAVGAEALARATAALRVRQARVLPRFAAAEDAARLAEVMSFALAVAVVVERIGMLAGRASAPGWCQLTDDVPASVALGDDPVPRSYGALLVPRLAGSAGLDWLGQEPVALRALAAYFGPGPSELRVIAEEAGRRAGLPLGGDPAVEDMGPDPATPMGAAAVEERADTPRPSAPVGGAGAGWRWVNWVRAGLRDGTIAVNAEGGWLHNIGGEAYVVVPDGFGAFAAVEEVEPKTVKNRVARLGRHRERGSPSGAANTFRVDLADGRRVAGMVFPGKLFWDDDEPPATDAKLDGGRG